MEISQQNHVLSDPAFLLYLFRTGYVHLYLVFTVFANHVTGQSPMERMLRFPVICHRGK